MNNNKVLLIKICPPGGARILPMSLLYIGGALKKKNYAVEIIHLEAGEADPVKLAGEIASRKPLFAGFSVITADPMKKLAQICRQIKKTAPSLPVVWGGIHPTLLPEQCLSEPYIDIIVRGEGEEAVIDLADALSSGKPLDNIQNAGFKDKNGKLTLNPERPFLKDLDKYTMDFSLVDMERYIYPFQKMKRVIDFVTSRGCPFECAFCYNVAFSKRKWRAHSPGKMASDINFLKAKYRLDGIIIDDDNFFVDSERAFSILEKTGLPHHSEARVEKITEPFLERLAKTKCMALFLGIESGSNRILKLIKKGFSVDTINKAIGLLSRYPEMRTACSAIFGYPTETKKEYRKTLSLILSHMRRHPYITYTTGFYLPYPGTELFELAVKNGFRPPLNTEEWEKLDRWGNKDFEITWLNWLTPNEIKKVRTLIYVYGNLIQKNSSCLMRKLIGFRLSLSANMLYNIFVPFENILIKYRKTISKLLRLIGLYG
jgi:radical SAM superfamily enzyme YgiQ (UPF0313 family)